MDDGISQLPKPSLPSAPTPLTPGQSVSPAATLAAAPVAPEAPTPAPAPSASPPPAPSPAPSMPQSPAQLASAPEPPAQISSRFLQNLQQVSATPFIEPEAPPLTAPPTSSGFNALPSSSGLSVSLGLNTAASNPLPSNLTGSSMPPSSPSAIPQEKATIGAVSPSGGGTPPAAGLGKAASAGGGFLRFFQNKMFLFGALGVALLLIVGGAAWYFLAGSQPTPVSTGKNASPAPQAKAGVELTYWGLWEPPEVMQGIIADYQKKNPNVKINYIQQKSNQYRSRLQASLRDGTGPDIFRFHNTWMPMFQNDIAMAPKDVFPAADLEKNYYPIMNAELVKNGQVAGTPLMFEGMALLYNQQMLEAANAQPPQDWVQLRALASKLAVNNGDRLERAGIALGLASNVDHFSDILGLMMLQNSANPGDPSDQNARDSLEFYTIFYRDDKVWNETFPPSVEAFANEQVAMIFAPSWRIFEIQRENPNIKIGVAKIPQLSDKPVTWGTYWAESVSKSSKNKEEAWKFLAYLSQPEQLRRFHSEAAKYRQFGEMYPRVDMAKELEKNDLITPYLEDGLYAKSWYMASMTHDEGLNDGMIQYYTDAINEMNTGRNSERAFNKVMPGIQQVLSKYGVTVQSSQTPATP